MMLLRLGRRLGIMGFILIGLFGLTGCQYTATPADLLQNPQVMPETERLADAMKNALPAKAKLSLQLHPQATSAVVMGDVDNDGIVDALVSFMNENGNQQVMVLRGREDGTWNYWFTFAEMSSYGIDRIVVEDLDDNGQSEVMIGWKVYGQPEFLLNVYQVRQYHSGKEPLLPIAELPYDTLEVGNVDGDGDTEVVTIVLDREGKQASLRIYRVKHWAFYKAMSIPLNGIVNRYYNLKVGKIAEDRYGIVTEASIGAHSSTTTMFAWSNGNLKQVYPSTRSNIPNEGDNVYSTESGDGNADGILDLHVLQEAPGQKPDTSYAETLWIQQYKQWDGFDGFQLVKERYVNHMQGFIVDVPLKWRGRYTVSRPEDEHAGIVFEYMNTKSAHSAPMFTIYAFPTADWRQAEQKWQDKGIHYDELLKAAGIQYAVLWGEPSAEWSKGEKEMFWHVQPDKSGLDKLFKLLPPR
ncbi:hypothetical protein PAECIP111893_03599 [Paenibacillus plantiphilus]|uniref:VCBS repeat-containing protein n=1 Tax=Paenibacillus plantiphilus TaxID=2905650 RepID=A0ABN8GML9_9BACL|nr:VCBS repeat-containing protein [Paenibacillus plantiphilus]CAH1212965.1 hypothetical protein PAECIP111893_03599 [Paenibacillus plantiphilus]